ncbi:hypothetical protein AGDE_14837 [Angomonas deanei]|uniref:Uncharacterized protein n=1 Tax=Angomonas deanei TaxID=59799 RepID=A0A7G2CTW5_9TRYP|nr:hypothetical protein AGDE_14837 [Angomonas deanei]CAD2222374.1 hypothetical protein, conserved [Angomonas deanei]|eukprot:EPY20144.1 hypothetical protein AGDE_14837 [Angomonas deanei]
MVAAQELTLAYEDIGSALIEIATANMKSNEGKIEAAQISLAALDQDDVPAAQESFLLELANNFRSHIREVHEGNPFQAYNTAIAKDVLDGFRPVKERIDVTLASIRSVEQMARSVAKSKNNPQKRREASPDSAASESDSAFEKLVQINNHTTAQNLHRYLYLNHTYIQELLCRLTGLSEKFSFVLSGAYQLMCEESHARGAVVVEESAARASQWSAHISAVLRGPQVQMANEEASQRAQIRRKEERQMTDLLDSAARGYFNLRGDELIQDESAARRSVEEEEKQREGTLFTPHGWLFWPPLFSRRRRQIGCALPARKPRSGMDSKEK